VTGSGRIGPRTGAGGRGSVCVDGVSSHAPCAVLAYTQHMLSHSMEQQPNPFLPACCVPPGLAAGSARAALTGERFDAGLSDTEWARLLRPNVSSSSSSESHKGKSTCVVGH
jgi:hypothetical protein